MTVKSPVDGVGIPVNAWWQERNGEMSGQLVAMARHSQLEVSHDMQQHQLYRAPLCQSADIIAAASGQERWGENRWECEDSGSRMRYNDCHFLFFHLFPWPFTLFLHQGHPCLPLFPGTEALLLPLLLVRTLTGLYEEVNCFLF